MERNEILAFTTGIVIILIIAIAFIILLATIYHQRVKMIRAGLYDEEIKRDYIREQKRSSKVLRKVNAFFSTVLCILFLCMFGISIYAQVTGNNFPISGLANARVVMSDSMSEKHEKNTYLVENNLNNQFDTYDIILTYELPKEEDLKLYDIVVYEVNDTLVVHRIIGIEEPNEKHPDERYFLLRGDASEYNDRFPVKYEQMKAIYKGETIPYAGVFIHFFQSTLGYIAMAIILGYCIVVPVVENKLDKVTIQYLKDQAFIIDVVDRLKQKDIEAF